MPASGAGDAAGPGEPEMAADGRAAPSGRKRPVAGRWLRGGPDLRPGRKQCLAALTRHADLQRRAALEREVVDDERAERQRRLHRAGQRIGARCLGVQVQVLGAWPRNSPAFNG